MTTSYVADLQAALALLLEKSYERTRRAINDSLSGTYTTKQLYQDTANTVVDGVYGSLLPFLTFLPLRLEQTLPIPTAHFQLTTAVDETVSIPVIASASVTKVEWEDLAIPGTTTTIPKKHVDVKIAGKHLLVKVTGTTVPAGTQADLYVGNVFATNLTPKEVIAQINLLWLVV